MSQFTQLNHHSAIHQYTFMRFDLYWVQRLLIFAFEHSLENMENTCIQCIGEGAKKVNHISLLSNNPAANVNHDSHQVRLGKLSFHRSNNPR